MDNRTRRHEVRECRQLFDSASRIGLRPLQASKGAGTPISALWLRCRRQARAACAGVPLDTDKKFEIFF